MPQSIVSIAVLLVTLVGGVRTRAADVDLSLVLAIDVSSSVNEEPYELQIRGYAEAFGNPLVADAIAQSGAIAVTLVPWAGYGDYQQVIGWTVIHDAATAS